MFENGTPTGDRPGELQFWVEQESFDETLGFSLKLHDLYCRNDGLPHTCTSGGVTNWSPFESAIPKQ